MVVKTDFYCSQQFGGYSLGLFVGSSRGDFLNFACLIISDHSNPGIFAAFVAYFDYYTIKLRNSLLEIADLAHRNVLKIPTRLLRSF